MHEQIVTFEEIMSLYGQVIISLEKYPGQLPYLSYSDPYMLSIVGKFHIQEKSAVLYRYVKTGMNTYPVKGMIQFAQFVLKQIWKNIFLSKPKTVGEVMPQDMARFAEKPDDLRELYSDFIVSLTGSGDAAATAKLNILQGDLKIR